MTKENIKTPLGGQRVTFGRKQFDKSGYDAAMAQYNARQPQATGAPPTVGVGGGAAMPTTGGGGVQMGGGMGGAGMYGGGGYGGGMGTDMGVSSEPMAQKGMAAANRAQQQGMDYTQGGGMPYGGGRFDASDMGPGAATRAGQGYRSNQYMGDTAPTEDMFTSMVDLDTPNIEQYLTPEAQATLDAQQRVERAFSGLGEKAIGRVQDVYGTAFTPQGLPEQQFQFQGGGTPSCQAVPSVSELTLNAI